MSSKEAILSKIRAGLAKGKVPMPFPEVDGDSANPFVNKTSEHGSLDVLFATEFSALGGKFMYCSSHQEFVQHLRSLAEANAWQQVFCQEGSLLNNFAEDDLPFIKTGNYDGNLDAAITFCKYAVARTGSLIIASDTASGRALPVYTPIHICVVKPQQLVFDIGDALKAAQAEYGNALPSMLNIATGPSRTADIEKTLVVGVHGPKEVYVMFTDY
jgi:L-lactate dehydrogenase complex protein LldG